jgi:hypothetical protein
LTFDREEDDELWLVLDTDHFIQSTHIKSFKNALQRARQAGVQIALSRPCFEIWLALHHAEYDCLKGARNAGEIEDFLKTTLNGYNKRLLRKSDFPIELVPVAVERARVVDLATDGGDPPKINTTRIYKLWESIVNGASPSQLPPVLHEILRDNA